VLSNEAMFDVVDEVPWTTDPLVLRDHVRVPVYEPVRVRDASLEGGDTVFDNVSVPVAESLVVGPEAEAVSDDVEAELAPGLPADKVENEVVASLDERVAVVEPPNCDWLELDEEPIELDWPAEGTPAVGFVEVVPADCPLLEAAEH